MDYQKQAADFLEQTGTKLTWKWLKHDYYFHGDKDTRDIYKFTLRRNGKQYSGTFGQSIAHQGQEPTAYDLLTCLTKWDPYTLEEQIHDSISALKIYKAVVREWKGVNMLFSDVLDKLQEIQ